MERRKTPLEIENERMVEANRNTRTDVYDVTDGSVRHCADADEAQECYDSGKYVDTPAKCGKKAEKEEERGANGTEPDWLSLTDTALARLGKTTLEEKVYYLGLTPVEDATKAKLLVQIQNKLKADEAKKDE